MPTVDNHPLYAHDNFIDTVFANEGAVFGTIHGTQEEVESLSSGRRERNPTPWKPGTGTNRRIEVDLGSGVSKAANLLWIGNGHNYGGETVKLQHSTSLGGAYTDLFSAVVDTDGKTLDDGSWAFVFEGTETSKRYWRVQFDNSGAVDINIPALWFGRFEQLTEYWPAPIDEFGGTVHRTGVNISDRGVRSAAVSSRLIHRLSIQIEDTDATASEFVNLIEPWLDTLALGALTLVVPDWPNAGERTRLYQLESDRLSAPFTVRGRHKPQFELVEIL